MRGGDTFLFERDHERLAKQHSDVFKVISDGKWHTLQELTTKTGHPTPSISARLRDFRKTQFGGYTIERRYLSKGLFEYRLKT